jgi:NADH dehydrogenase (ubiquinone) Fe-S protein 6
MHLPVARRALARARARTSASIETTIVGRGAAVAAARRAFAAVPTVSSTPSQPVQSKRPGKLPTDVAHTAKWLDSTAKPSPMEYSARVEPIGVRGDKVNCDSPGACKDRFGDSGGLGAPNTYYKLNDTSPTSPAKCKYCGLRFFSLGGGGH